MDQVQWRIRDKVVNLDMKKRFIKCGYCFRWPVSVKEEELRLQYPDTKIHIEECTTVFVDKHVEEIRYKSVPSVWRVVEQI